MSIHVGNLDYEVGQNTQTGFFSEYGAVNSVHLRTGKQVESEVWPLYKWEQTPNKSRD